MERKLIRQGKGGYTIYLPKKWIDAQGLTASDSVHITEEQDTLIISAQGRVRKHKSIVITAENKEHVEDKITQLYIEGYNEIVLKGLLDAKKNKKIVDGLLGFEIVEQDNRKCVLNNLSEPPKEKCDAFLRRCWLLVAETATILREELADGSYVRGRELRALKLEQEKYIRFLRRKRKNLQKTLDYLEQLENNIYEAYRFAYAKKVRTAPIVLRLLDDYRQYYDTIRKGRPAQKERAIQLCYELLERGGGPETAIVAHIREWYGKENT